MYIIRKKGFLLKNVRGIKYYVVEIKNIFRMVYSFFGMGLTLVCIYTYVAEGLPLFSFFSYEGENS